MTNHSILFNEALNRCYIALNDSYFDDEILCTKFSQNDSVYSFCIACISEKQLTYTFTKIQQFLQYNSTMLLLIPSITFNLLSFLVLLSFSKDNKKIGINDNGSKSMNFYLKCLCIFDTLTILSKSVHEFIDINNDERELEDKIELNLFFCKIMYFFSSVCKITSVYLLVLMSIDRLIATISPFKVLSSMSPKRSKILFTILFLCSILYSLCYILVEFQEQTNANSTNITENNSISYQCNPNKKMDITNDIVNIFVPILLLFACNLSIHISLSKQGKTILKINKTSPKIKKNADTSKNVDSVQTFLSDSNVSKNSSKYEDNSLSKERNKKQKYNKRQLDKISMKKKNSSSISGIF
jgi:hypothetical protein